MACQNSLRVLFVALLSAVGALAQKAPLAALIEIDALQGKDLEPQVHAELARSLSSADAAPRDPAAAGELGRLLHAHGALDYAVIAYDRAAQLSADAFEWSYLAGVARKDLGLVEEAAASLRQALEASPQHTPTRLALAELENLAGDFSAAERRCHALLADQPRLPQAHYQLGRALGGQGRAQEAANAFAKAVELAPHYPAARYALALELRGVGEQDRARREFEIYRGLRALPPPEIDDPLLDRVRGLDNSARAMVARGAALARAGAWDEAAAELEAALEANPKLVAAHANLIGVYGALADYARAEKHFNAAKTLEPGWADAYFAWAGVETSRSNYSEAVQAYRTLLRLSPGHAEARIRLAQLLEEQGEEAEAVSQYRAALEADPLRYDARHRLGLLLLRTGRTEEGLNSLARAAEAPDERRAAFLLASARAYETAGRREAALKAARRARQAAGEYLDRNIEDEANELIQRLEKEPR